MDTDTSTTSSEEGGFNHNGAADHVFELPEGCIAKALSFTSPTDACRLSSVSSIFKSAAESDAVWERFLPSDYQSLVSSSGFSSKKEVFLSLCDHPVLIDGGKKSFSLDKQTGKKCYMLSARKLMIVWADTPTYWRWISVPESQFSEVAELVCVCWLEIRGRISTRVLSPDTTYAAYLVYKLTAGPFGFEFQPVEVSFGLVGNHETEKQTVYLDTERVQRQRQQYGYRVSRRIGGPFNFRSRYMAMQGAVAARETGGIQANKREDGWLEMELGDFFNAKGGQEDELEMSVTEVKGGDWKGGIIIQGIEIRPKHST